MAVTCSCCGGDAERWVPFHTDTSVKVCFECLDWLNGHRRRQLQNQRLLGAAGGWIVEGFEPIFTVADVARSAEHYEKLGFEVSHHDDTYAFARHSVDLSVHLAQAEDDGTGTWNSGRPPGAGALYIHCDDADVVAEEWRRAGLQVAGPRDEDYGKREGAHADPDGNVIRFGSPVRRPEADAD
jgi:catechol 2,3-dioxygenase-like lactoylglutathione lyase family enzyme